MMIKGAIILFLLFFSFCVYVHAGEHQDETHIGEAESGGITFSDEDMIRTQVPHNHELVVTMKVANIPVDKILIDTGASDNVIFLSTLKWMALSEQLIDFHPTEKKLAGLFGGQAKPLGIITLPVTAGSWPRSSTVMVDFLVVDSNLGFGFNIIFGRSGIHALRAVPSTYHLLLCFPTKVGIGEVRGDQWDQLQASKNYKPGCPPRQMRRTEALLLAFEIFSVFIIFFTIFSEVYAERKVTLFIRSLKVQQCTNEHLV